MSMDVLQSSLDRQLRRHVDMLLLLHLAEWLIVGRVQVGGSVE